MQTIYGSDIGRRTLDTHLVKDLMDGPYAMLKWWALIEDIFNDYEMTKRLLKYFATHCVPRDMWIDAYKNLWDLHDLTPHNDLKWHGKVEL